MHSAYRMHKFSVGQDPIFHTDHLLMPGAYSIWAHLYALSMLGGAQQQIDEISNNQYFSWQRAVQLSAVQCSAVECIAGQCSAVEISAVQCNAVHCNKVPCSVLQCSTVQNSLMKYSLMMCSAVMYSKKAMYNVSIQILLSKFFYKSGTYLTFILCLL